MKLIKRHEQELVAFHEHLSNGSYSLEPVQLDLDIHNQDSENKQGTCWDSNEQPLKNDAFKDPMAANSVIESVLELACAPSGRNPHGTVTKHTNPGNGSMLKRSHTESELSLELHPIFRISSSEFKQSDFNRQLSENFMLVDPTQVRAGDELRDEWSNRLDCLVSHPLTMRRLIYDMFSMALIWYELLIIPLEFTGLVGTRLGLDVAIAVIWTIDLVLSFFQGVEEYGVVDMRLSRTVLAYLKSWFFLDFGLVLLDWVLIMLTQQVVFAGVARSAKMLRFWRGFRMLKFLRFYRVPKAYLSTKNLLRSSAAQTTLKITAWLAGIVMLNHVIACFWYFIGMAPGDNPSWIWAVKELYVQQTPGREPGKWYLYFTALHWAVTQFTPASMEVSPKNVWERVYNLFAIFISLVLFPTFLTSITNSVTALGQQNADYSEAKRKLTRYLQENRISLKLSSRIQSVAFAQYDSLRNAERVHEPDVQLLKLLPRSLKEQMHAEVYQPLIIRHPFLEVLACWHERILTKICHTAMSQESLKSGDELFAHGREAEKVHFVLSGNLLYFEGSSPSPQNREDVHAGCWVCDQVLWIQWVHRGLMTAVQPCELANLDGGSFRKLVAKYPRMRSLCSRFAKRYVAAIKENEFEGCCNDLGCSVEALQNLSREASGMCLTRGPSDLSRQSQTST